MIYLDTHVVVWLYAGQTEHLSPLAQSLIETEDLRVSPMVVLELEYLREIGRVTVPARDVIDDLSPRLGLAVCQLPFSHVVSAALRENWTRDPFDRLIVAQSIVGAAPLLTRDRTIQKHYADARWDAGE